MVKLSKAIQYAAQASHSPVEDIIRSLIAQLNGKPDAQKKVKKTQGVRCGKLVRHLRNITNTVLVQAKIVSERLYVKEPVRTSSCQCHQKK